MTNLKRRIIIALAGGGLTLILVGLAPIMALAQDSAPEEPTETTSAFEWVYEAPEMAIEATGNNGYCRLCHSQPWQSTNLADGSVLNLFVAEEVLASSVHGELGCVDCHGEDSFPHSGPTPTDARTYTLDSVSMCVGCHVDQLDTMEHSLHVEAISEGNLEAAVCTDCHGAHDVRPVVEQPGLVAGVCGDCHTSTLIEWQGSPHSDIGPLGCGSCHNPHSQQMRSGEQPSDMCITCHQNMPELWVHNTHLVSGETETGTNVTCIDCHMYVPDSPETVNLNYSEMPSGHSMMLDSRPCTDCHQNLAVQNINLSDGGGAGAFNPPTVGNDPDDGGTDETALLEECTEPGNEDCETPAFVEGEGEELMDEVLVETTSGPDYIQLLQGLILGIGFGITGAAIFITRGNRAAKEEE